MQAERMQLHALRQSARNAAGEIAEHILAGRLVVHRDDVAETFGEHGPQRRVARRLTQDEGVVEVRHDLFVDDALQHPEIHHHPAFRVSFAGRRTSLDGHEKPVGVAVNLTAWPVVSVQSVRRFEGELFCQSDHCHMRKDIH